MVINLKALFVVLGVICLFVAGVPRIAAAVPGLNFLALGLAFIAAGEFLL